MARTGSLADLIGALRRAPSGGARLGVLLRSGQLLRRLPASQRRSLLTRIGFSEAEQLISQVGDDRVQEALEAALSEIESDPGGWKRLAGDLRNPAHRRQAITGLVGRIEEILREPSEGEADDVEDEITPDLAAAPSDVDDGAMPPGSDEAGEEASVETDDDAASVDSTLAAPGPTDSSAADPEVPVGEPSPPDVGEPSMADPDRAASAGEGAEAVRPVDGDIRPESVPTASVRSSDDRSVAFRAPRDAAVLATGERDVSRRVPPLELLRSIRAAVERGARDTELVAELKSSGARGWTRRRAVEILVGSDVVPVASSLDLIETLPTRSDRLWCLTAMVSGRPWSDEAWSELMAWEGLDPSLRRRLAHRRQPVAV